MSSTTLDHAGHLTAVRRQTSELGSMVTRPYAGPSEEVDFRSAVLPIVHSLELELAALRGLLELPADEVPGGREGPGGRRAGHPAGAGEREATPRRAPAGEQLTSREQEVLNLLVQGVTNHIIARSLGITVPTVKAHLRSTFRKLGVNGRTEAIVHVLSDKVAS